MTTLAIHHDAGPLLKPQPRPGIVGGAISIRVAVPGASDFAFIDDLQKQHSKMVGWMPTKQLETYIQRGHVLIAETKVDKSTNQQVEMAEAPALRPDGSDVDLSTCRLVDFAAQPVGYCIWRDQYFKRDDCGIIYQLNVLPARQRGLIGAALIKAVFERAAYGCKLFCCWCAQDLEANQFWESLGFIPLAFRAGSRDKQRIHIFWQRRVRENDSDTPYWFPSQTTAGALREDRLVIPIPPGTHWSDAKPMLLPGLPGAGLPGAGVLPGADNPHPKSGGPLPPGSQGEGAKQRKPRPRGPKPKPSAVESKSIRMGGLRFAPGVAPQQAVEAKPPKPKREKPAKQKNDPKYIAAARELRDRYLEQVNSGAPGCERMLPASHGKYDVSRQLVHGADPAPGLAPGLAPVLGNAATAGFKPTALLAA